MTEAQRRFLEDRETRNAARGVFDANLAQVRADLEARSVGGRLTDHATGEAKAALSEGLAVARESKGIIAGTIGALLLWFFREPLITSVQGLLRRDDDTDDQAPVQD